MRRISFLSMAYVLRSNGSEVKKGNNRDHKLGQMVVWEQIAWRWGKKVVLVSIQLHESHIKLLEVEG
jgi:hypothetical protein